MLEIGAKQEARKKKLEFKRQTREHCAICGVEIVPDPNEEDR